MQMILFELKKLISEKSFIVITLALTVTVILYSALIDVGYSRGNYDKLRCDVSGKTQDEIGEILEDRVLEYQIYDALIWGGGNEDAFNDERSAAFAANFVNIEKNSVEIMKQLELYKTEYSQYLLVSGYSGHLDGIINNNAGFSLFNDKNSFTYKCSQKAARVYKNLAGVQPVYAPGEGVRNTFSNPAVSIALLILVTFAAIKLFTEERQNGGGMLAVSMKNGSVRFPLAKLAAILVISLAGSVIFSLVAAAVNEIRFGLFDLSRAIQSVEGYYNSPLKMSVGVFLIANVLVRALCGAVFGYVTAVFGIVFRQGGTFAFSGVFAAASAVYYLIDDVSILAPIKYLSILAPLDAESFFGKYLNLSLFGVPVEAAFLTFVFLVVLSALAAAGVLMLYKQFCVPADRKSRISRKMSFTTSITGNEAKRIFFERKGIFVLCASAVLCGIYVMSISRPLDVDDMMYADLIRNVGGEITDDTYAFIEAEKSRYNEVNEELAELSALYSEGRIDNAAFTSEYAAVSQKLMGQRSLARLEEQLRLVENNSHAELIYDTGWVKLFSGGLLGGLISSLIAATVIILIIAPVYSSDSESGMDKLIRSTRFGVKRLGVVRSSLSIIVGILTVAAVFGAEIWRISDLYGFDSFNSSVRNIAFFSAFPFEISILSYLIILTVIKMLVWTGASLIALLVSRISPKTSVSLAGAGTAIVLPMVLMNII